MEIIYTKNNIEEQSLLNDKISLNEENHKYTLKGKEHLHFTSVTECVSDFFEPFNKEEIAKKLVTTHANYKHYTQEELIKEWNATGTYGTLVHNQIEQYIVSNKKPEDKKALAAIDWLGRYLLKSDFDIFSEVIIYCERLQIAGTIDLLAYDKINNHYHILDWKTNKKLPTKSFKGKTGNKPETINLLDCKFNHYSLQLSLYRYLLEKNYGINVMDQTIVHLGDDGVHGYISPYLINNIHAILKHY